MKISLIFFAFLCTTYGSLKETKNTKPKRAVSGIPEILKKAIPLRTLFKDVFDIWTYVLREPNTGIKGALIRVKEKEIIDHLLTINTRILMLDQKAGAIADTTIDNILQTFPSVLKLELDLQELSVIRSQINFASNRLQNYLIHGYKSSTDEEIEILLETSNTNETYNSTIAKNNNAEAVKRNTEYKWQVEKFTLQQYANWATGYASNAPMTLLSRIHDLVVDDFDDDGLFENFVKVSKVCDFLVPKQYAFQGTFEEFTVIYWHRKPLFNLSFKHIHLNSFSIKALALKQKESIPIHINKKKYYSEM